MTAYKIAAIPGDGIGVEVIAAGVEVLQALSKKSGFELEGCVECHEGDAGQQDGGVITYDW